MKTTIAMTHQEIENLLMAEAARRRQEALRHIAPLGGVDTAKLLRWKRRATVLRCMVAIGLMTVAPLFADKAFAQQPMRGSTLAQGAGHDSYTYIVSQGDPEQTYDTLCAILLKR